MNPSVNLILMLLQSMFAKNQVVEELIPIIQQGGAALTNAKAGQPFSVIFPETIDGKPGITTIDWKPLS